MGNPQETGGFWLHVNFLFVVHALLDVFLPLSANLVGAKIAANCILMMMASECVRTDFHEGRGTHTGVCACQDMQGFLSSVG